MKDDRSSSDRRPLPVNSIHYTLDQLLRGFQVEQVGKPNININRTLIGNDGEALATPDPGDRQLGRQLEHCVNRPRYST